MSNVIKALRYIKTKIKLATMDSADYVDYLQKQGIKVGKNVKFRYPQHTLIDTTRPTLVEFGDNIDINDNFTVLTHDFTSFVLRGKYRDYVNSSGPVIIGNNVVVGRNVTLLKGAVIGDNSIIALGSIVTKSMPPNSVIAGVPAHVICTLDDYYAKRKERQILEAMDSIIKREKREPQIEDFTEEWTLFLTKDDYILNPIVQRYVDMRLSSYITLDEFFASPKPFNGFDTFMHEVHHHLNA